MIRSMRWRAPLVFAVAALAASVTPLLAWPEFSGPDRTPAFPGWPTHLEGLPLTELPLTAREAGFVQSFPGRVARFTDGEREIILRWVASPTRKLHPAADCFRASGYAIAPLPARASASGSGMMGCFRASRGGEAMSVCEIIRDGEGYSWPDVSAWFWHALFGGARGPWWAVVVAQKA